MKKKGKGQTTHFSVSFSFFFTSPIITYSSWLKWVPSPEKFSSQAEVPDEMRQCKNLYLKKARLNTN